MEFRAYVRNKKLVGLQQKDETAFYPGVGPIKPLVFERVSELVKRLRTELPAFDSYAVDVYIDLPPKHKAWVQDINSLTKEFHDSQLFSFDELSSEAEAVDATLPAEFRTLSEDSQLRPAKHADNQFPVELQSMDELQKVIDSQMQQFE